MNPYAGLLELLPESRLHLALSSLCLEEAGQCASYLEREFDRLEEMGLARRHLMGWVPTWLGYGVFNWSRQLEAACWRDRDVPVPEPRAQENGEQPGPECNLYREMYFKPGICWCLRRAGEHPSYLPEIAMSMLRHHNQELREKALLQAGQGRPLPQLACQINACEQAVLLLLADHWEGQSLGELALKLGLVITYFELKEAVDRLLDLELVLGDPLRASWEGRGVATWLRELRLATGQPTQPEPGENGCQPTAQPCSRFRSLVHDSSKCWCGWPRKSHQA